MFKKLIVLFLISTSFYVCGQNRIKFEYDNSGYQTKRYLCFGCLAKDSNDKMNESEILTGEDILIVNEIKFYPNPVSQILNIDWKNEISDIESIQLFSINGQLIKNIEIFNESKSISIPFDNVEVGTYFVNVVFQNNKRESITILKK